METAEQTSEPVSRERTPTARLTADDVRLILELVEAREDLKQQLRQLTNEKIAEKFDVSTHVVARIATGKTGTPALR